MSTQEIILQFINDFTSRIGRRYRKELYNLGKKSVETGVKYALNQLPVYIRPYAFQYFGYKYKKGEKIEIPKTGYEEEIDRALQPIYKPFVDGVIDESRRVGYKVLPLLTSVLFSTVISIAGIGYYLGKRTK